MLLAVVTGRRQPVATVGIHSSCAHREDRSRRWDAEQVRIALVDAGYQTHRDTDGQWQTRECCGEWDAVWARAEDHDDGEAQVSLTMADSDIQVSFGFFLILGLPVLAIGATLLTTTRWNSDHDRTEAAVPV